MKSHRKKRIAILNVDAIYLEPAFTSTDQNTFNYEKYSYPTSIGIRIQKITEYLSQYYHTTLFIPDLNYPDKPFLSPGSYEVRSYDFCRNQGNHVDSELYDSLLEYDCVIIPTSRTTAISTVASLPSNIYVVVDGFIPLLPELCAAINYRDDIDHEDFYKDVLQVYMNLVRRSNLFLYTSQNQKAFYDGVLYSSGKYTGAAPTGNLLLNVPHGIEDVPLVRRTVTSDTLDLLWYGCAYPWYDTCLLADTVKSTGKIKVTYFGVQHTRYKRYFSCLEQQYNFQHENITIDKTFQLGPMNNLFSKFDACVTIVKPWDEGKYAHRHRYLYALNHGMPIIISDTEPLLEENPFLEPLVIQVNNDNLLEDLTRIRKDKAFLLYPSKDIISKVVTSLRQKYNWKTVLLPLLNKLQEVL